MNHTDAGIYTTLNPFGNQANRTMQTAQKAKHAENAEIDEAARKAVEAKAAEEDSDINGSTTATAGVTADMI